MLASIAEDIKFRKEELKFHFRPNFLQLTVLHKSTNEEWKELIDDAQHKLARSEHCKECCAKGGDAC